VIQIFSFLELIQEYDESPLDNGNPQKKFFAHKKNIITL